MKVLHLIFIAGLIALAVEGSSRRGPPPIFEDDDHALGRPVHFRSRASDYDGVIHRGYRNDNDRRQKKRSNVFEERGDRKPVVNEFLHFG
uniref:Uncharacterized protein n=1 Tax=Panagrellus redivivus TaxID=6233 RepID=A0A7E4VUQ7_PANRE